MDIYFSIAITLVTTLLSADYYKYSLCIYRHLWSEEDIIKFPMHVHVWYKCSTSSENMLMIM